MSIPRSYIHLWIIKNNHIENFTVEYVQERKSIPNKSLYQMRDVDLQVKSVLINNASEIQPGITY